MGRLGDVGLLEHRQIRLQSIETRATGIEAIAAAKLLETPDEARARIKNAGAKPIHYIPRAAIPDAELPKRDESGIDPYKKMRAP